MKERNDPQHKGRRIREFIIETTQVTVTEQQLAALMINVAKLVEEKPEKVLEKWKNGKLGGTIPGCDAYVYTDNAKGVRYNLNQNYRTVSISIRMNNLPFSSNS